MNWTIERARRYLLTLPPAVSGQRGHDTTFHAACVLVKGFGLDRETALGLLREFNQRCRPPWSEKELRHKVEDADRTPDSRARGYLVRKGNRANPRRPVRVIWRIDRGQRATLGPRKPPC